MNTFKWLLKREYWENRGGFKWAPIITAGVLLLLSIVGFAAAEMAVGRIGLKLGPSKLDLNAITANMTAEQMSQVGAAIDLGLFSIAMPISLVLAFVLFFYLLGSLYDERRDRSILFWKSLPVSDLQTVLSKVATATVIAPLMAIGAALVLMFAFLLVVSAFVMFHGVNPITTVWMNASPFSVAAKMIVVLPINALWALPTVGWLMLCSAFAKRAVFLWAVLVPVAAGVMVSSADILQRISIPDSFFWKYIVVRGLTSVMPGSWLDLSSIGDSRHIDGPAGVLKLIGLERATEALASPNLWIGAVVGVAMIGGAVWLRRWRDDS